MPRPDTWWVTSATNEVRFGTVFLVVGLVAVFLEPMSFFGQVLLGAPVFEESFKFGLAMVLVGSMRLRSLAVRVGVAWGVGGSFGVLEHFFTYSGEADWHFWVRIAFHALAAGLSMAGYRALQSDWHVATRWGATVASATVHYLNNLGALMLGIGALVRGASKEEVEAVALPFTAAILCVLALLYAVVLLWPRGYAAVARRPVRFLARHI